MTVKRRKSVPAVLLHKAKKRGAFTLVEVMAATLILTVVVLGAAGYRYYTALDVRKSSMHTAGARIALLLSESWRGVKGIETYDPTAHFGTDLAITASGGSSAPGGFTLLGSYTVALNGVNYYATLSWKDVVNELRALNVVVAWSHNGQETTNVADADKSFKLTTYTLN